MSKFILLTLFTLTFLSSYSQTTVGNPVTDRGSNNSAGYTVIDLNTTAGSSGTITSLSAYFASASGTRNFYVGVFTYNMSQYSYYPTAVVNLGSFNIGLNTWTNISLPIIAGQQLGFYIEGSGNIEADYNSSAYSLYLLGNMFTQLNVPYTYNYDAGCINSFLATYGSPGFKLNSLTITKWDNTTIKKLNNK